jgi:hypothetical protein
MSIGPIVSVTVQAVLAARLDRLPPEEKRLLQTAAVIGTEVPWPLLQTIAGLPEEALHRGLAHVQAAEFLYEARLFPDLVYTFKHALAHEVAYGTILQERRRTLHVGIVEASETLYCSRLTDQVERLAHHALRGELWNKAVAYCRQAGDRAVARSAGREAVACFEQALVALAHLPEGRERHEQAIDVRFGLPGLPAVTSRDVLVRCLAEVGAFSEGLAHGEEGLRIAEAVNHPHSLSGACYCLGYIYLRKSDVHQALPWLERGLEASRVWDIPLLFYILSSTLERFAVDCQENMA